jgi:hypothetical protein
MTPEVDLEGLRMSSDPLPVDDLHRRVAGTLGKLDAGALSQLLMRHDRGCVSLVSVRSFFLLASDCPWFSQPRLFVCLQEVGHHKPSLPPIPEDAVDRAARRVAAEKRKEKKDAKKARAYERTRARDALERLRRWQERDGLRPGSSFVCPDPDFPFLLSKRRHGSTGLSPQKVLKTASASAASAAPGLAGQLTSSQDAPQRGAQVAPVAVGRAPEADSSVEAVVALGEATSAAVASGPPDMLPAVVPAAAEAVAVLAVEPPVAADAEMAEASLLGASEEGGTEPRPVPSSGSLVPARRSSDGRRQLLRFRTRGASDPFFVLDDEREDQSWDGLRECAEAMVGSLRSTLEVLCRDVPKIL